MINSKIRLLVVLLFCGLTALALPKNYISINYTPKQFGINYEAEVRAIAQNRVGVMLFGSASGILTFDGQMWNRIEVKQGIWVQSILPADNSDTIFVGGQNEFGFLHHGINGPVYESLSDQIGDSVLLFSNIWKILRSGQQVCFQSDECLFVYDGNNVKIIESPTSFHNSFCVNGNIYVRQRESGLFRLNGTQLELVEGGKVFADIGIFGMVGIGNDKVLIISYEDGVWIMSDNVIGRQATGLSWLLSQTGFKVTSCTPIDSTTLALGSFDNGILIATTDGHQILQKNTNNGLIDNTINSIFRDYEQNLWVTTKKGISLMPNNSRFSVFAQESGINGSVFAIERSNNVLYVGTSVGLFEQGDDGRFKPVDGMGMHIWCLKSDGNRLLIGTDDGLYQLVPEHKANRLSPAGQIADVRCIAIGNDNRIFAGSSHGLFVYQKDKSTGLPRLSSTLINGFSVNSIQTETAGSRQGVWLGSNNQGLAHIIFTPTDTTAEFFDQSNGLDSGLAQPVSINGATYVLNSNGHIFALDSAEVDDGYFLKFFDDARLKIVEHINLIEDCDSMVWISQGTNIGYTRRGDSLLTDKPYRGLDVGKINVIFVEEDAVWLGATDGLAVCYNMPYTSDQRFFCLIRNVVSRDTAVGIWVHNPRISYSNNSISFNFAAPWFQTPGNVQFSFRLDGLGNSSWSEWSSKNSADFSGLREGNYVFRVKARNAFGIRNGLTVYNFTVNNNEAEYESSVAEYHFSIRPPWYRTALAYIIYLIMLMIVVYGIIKYYTYQLKERNRILDNEVKRQTKQIQEQLVQIADQNKSLTDSINYAARIQRLSLPTTDVISKYVSESFILFKPRDIVSGDFYWCAEVDNKLVITAADCTGHGVPGAMMSMLGMNSLNSIVKQNGTTDPGQILDQLRDYVIRSFADKGQKAAKDGMDLCLLTIDRDNSKLYFAGAFNSLYQVRNGELTEHKVDRFPCAISEHEGGLVPFTTQSIDIRSGDCFYFMSDGFCDQFGGQDGTEKFKKSRFRQYLLELWELPMEEQGQRLDQIHIEFKGNAFQIDDILVIGLRI